MEDRVPPPDGVDVETGGSSDVGVLAIGSPAAEPLLDLRVLSDRVKVLEQSASSISQSDSSSYLRNRITELEQSERNLLLQFSQLAAASRNGWPSVQHTRRQDQKLHTLRDEVRTMTLEKERVERVWRDRLQRCQNQLRVKEEEMGRQSQYFESFKTQLLHKLSLARDREQSLQCRVHTLEKQLLDMTVAAATNIASISAVSITAGSALHRGEIERLPCLRGEGEGEEEGEEKKKKEEEERRRKQVPGYQRVGGKEGDVSSEVRLQGFILSLQEDLKVLLEREEQGVVERRELTEQLQEAQENGHFLGCKVEGVKAEVYRLKLSESSLMEQVEELREENQRLQQDMEATGQTPSQTSTIAGSAFPSPGPSSPIPTSTSPAPGSCPSLSLSNGTAMRHCSANSFGKAKPDLLNLSAHLNSKHNLSLQSLSLTTDAVEVGAFSLGTWCSRGALNLEECPSEESDALRDAYISLGLGEDVEALRKQRDHLEATLRRTQEQLQTLTQENCQLKLQLREQEEEVEEEPSKGPSKEKIHRVPTQNTTTQDSAVHLSCSSTQEDPILTLAEDDLAQALNQENRALAERIQEMLAHMGLQEAENAKELAQLRQQMSGLEADGTRLKQENQEHGCLITELTRKTEDDLNTIMELQQRLAENEQVLEESSKCHHIPESVHLQNGHMAPNLGFGGIQQNNLEGIVDALVDRVLHSEDRTESISHSQANHLTTDSAFCSQDDDHDVSTSHSLRAKPQGSLLSDGVEQLTRSVQNQEKEQEELMGSVRSLREEQREVSLWIQTQTEEKQQLTRTVWGLKEERDGISQSLSGLRQDREQLSRTVCGIKDERDQFIRSMSGLKDEKEQLTVSLSQLRDERETVSESLSSEKAERDQIAQTLQSLQKERDRLSQEVCDLKQESEDIMDSFHSLKESRDQEQSREERDKLSQSICSLNEQKDKIERSIAGLKKEEHQIRLSLLSLREEELQVVDAAAHCSQSQQWSGLNNADMATKTVEVNGKQEQIALMTEVEALGVQLRMLRQELDQSQLEIQRLNSKLCESEATRAEAEKRADQTANEMMRLTDVTNEMEDARKENDSLTAQVKELHSRLAGLTREKADTLTLKAQIEEQFNILQAQLKAKTVALEELNSEYTSLRRDQGNKEEWSATLTSLRSRYGDIRSKYDVLLKKKSQTDLDIAPLKAKLSCLVVKCQERNSLLAQMMRAMNRSGCADFTLTQQAEHLLCDTALQDYTTAFSPNVKIQDYTTAFIPDVKKQDYSTPFTPNVKIQDYTTAFIPDVKIQDYTTAFIPDLKIQDYTTAFTPNVKIQDYTTAFTPNVKKQDYTTAFIPNVKKQDYTTAFTPNVKKQDYTAAFTPDVNLQQHDYNGGFTFDQNCNTIFPPGVRVQEYPNGLTPGSGLKHLEHTGGNRASLFTAGPPAKLQENISEFTPKAGVKSQANSPVPTSAVSEHANVQTPSSPVVPAEKRSLPVACNITQKPQSPGGPVQTPTSPDRLGLYHVGMKGESSSVPANGSESRGRNYLRSAPLAPDRCFSLGRRLSSPEKIISLHHELQKTLSSSYQAPVRRKSEDIQVGDRGRRQHPKEAFSYLSSGDLNLTSQAKNLTVTSSTPLPVTIAPGQTTQTTVTLTTTSTKPIKAAMSATLFSAVASRSANVTLNPSKLTHTKAATGTATSAALSSYSNAVKDMGPSKSTSSGLTPVSFKQTRQSTSIPTASPTAQHPVATTITPRSTTSVNTVNSAATVPTVFVCTVTNTDTTAPSIPTAPKVNLSEMTESITSITGDLDSMAHVFAGLTSPTACSKSAPPSPGRSCRPIARKSTLPPDKTKRERPKPEAPAEVGSVEVIRNVGQSSLMIGWERPPLDELGCSNGTFVYGYRVYLDGEFHKSVMSSACTKCILENMDSSVPIHISVQTLGSNGLSSNQVHTVHRAPVRTDSFRREQSPHPPIDSQSDRTDSFRREQSPHPAIDMSPHSASPDHNSPPLHRHSGLTQHSLSNSPVSKPPMAETKTCMAIYSYSPLRDSPNLHPSRELALREGDTVTLLGNPRHDGFCEAQVNGRRGLAPIAYLEELSVSESRPMNFTS